MCMTLIKVLTGMQDCTLLQMIVLCVIPMIVCNLQEQKQGYIFLEGLAGLQGLEYKRSKAQTIGA